MPDEDLEGVDGDARVVEGSESRQGARDDLVDTLLDSGLELCGSVANSAMSLEKRNRTTA